MELTTRRTAAKGRGGKRRKVNPGLPEPEEDDVLNLADKIVAIELISREVFRRLDFKDLLNCSLVNLTWRASARLHLRTHCRCFFSFSPKTMKLKQRKFSDLYDLLTNSSDVPFNGIPIITPIQQSFHDSEESPKEGNESTASQATVEERFISALEWEVALGRLEVKYLELDWRGGPYSTSSRVAIREILRRSSSSLVDLTVLGWNESSGVLHFFGVNVLPKVKVLQLPGKDWRRLNAVDLEELFNALPRLQSIRGPVNLLSLPAFIRTNKQHLIHEFNFATCSASEPEVLQQTTAEELLETVLTFARSQPQLTKLTLLTEIRGFRRLLTPSRYLSALEALVRGGAEVLKEVEIGFGDLLPLISPSTSISRRHSPPLFPAVTNLFLQFKFGILTDFSRTGLRNLNLEAHFPLLHSVELDCVMGSYFFPFTDERRAEEYCCKSVRRLAVRNTGRLCSAADAVETTWKIESLTKLFPMVRVLVLKDCSEFEDLIESLLGHGGALWEELRVLRLEGIEEETVRMNWDTLFTGLSTEDCHILKGQGKPEMQFLEELRLKAREEGEGSLLDLKKLEKLQLGMEHYFNVCETRKCAGNAFASTLIGECVWTLMGLRVEIKRRLCQKELNCCLALKHLQPFVHFVDKFTD